MTSDSTRSNHRLTSTAPASSAANARSTEPLAAPEASTVPFMAPLSALSTTRLSEAARKPLRKAIIPVAGFGTRMLPAAKAVPKELLPVLDRPTVQYVIEEAANAGVDDILLI